MNRRKRKQPSASSAEAAGRIAERWRCSSSPLFYADCIPDEKGPYQTERECLSNCLAVPSDVTRMYMPYLDSSTLSKLAQVSINTRVFPENRLHSLVNDCLFVLERAKEALVGAVIRTDSSTFRVQHILLTWYSAEHYDEKGDYVEPGEGGDIGYRETYQSEQKKWVSRPSFEANTAQEYCKYLISNYEDVQSKILDFYIEFRFELDAFSKGMTLIVGNKIIPLQLDDILFLDENGLTLLEISYDSL